MRSLFVALIVLAALAAPSVVAAERSIDTKSIAVSATVGTRTSLTVSSHVLHFDATSPGECVEFVDFVAAARTRAGGEVLLTVEPLSGGEALDGRGAVTSVSFAGEGEGALAGAMTAMAPSVAARWHGSGRRTGRVTFSLRAAVPGRYTFALRFVLTAP
jgi:hypothetical protein